MKVRYKEVDDKLAVMSSLIKITTDALSSF